MHKREKASIDKHPTHLKQALIPLCPPRTDPPVDVGVLQVERLAGVVAQDEREHRVLHEVVEGAAGVLVEVREVFEVGDLARAPQLGERRDVAVLQQVGQV